MVLDLCTWFWVDKTVKDLRYKFDPLIEEKREDIAVLQEKKRDLMEFMDNEANH